MIPEKNNQEKQTRQKAHAQEPHSWVPPEKTSAYLCINLKKIPVSNTIFFKLNKVFSKIREIFYAFVNSAKLKCCELQFNFSSNNLILLKDIFASILYNNNFLYKIFQSGSLLITEF
ncbi:hypothetical protein V1477_016962 [Vespula maculifrons]|uniref:Uncharacterized protein n=1 Tax=Vespula maculifrons TaxID=7453 RepID=A0ABD2B4T3_VESMC